MREIQRHNLLSSLLPRCQSLKLSECIRIQGDEIQKVDDLRKQLRECKYANIIATEERDSKIQELMELKKWTEALKTRFDVVEKEKKDSMEKNEVVSNNCVFLQDTVRSVEAILFLFKCTVLYATWCRPAVLYLAILRETFSHCEKLLTIIYVHVAYWKLLTQLGSTDVTNCRDRFFL